MEVGMPELCHVEEISALPSVNYLSYLVENAVRCYRLARGLTDADFMRQLAELGQEYAAEALERGADPKSLPQPDEWRRISEYAQ
jgi:hypothetical protein